MSCEVKQNHEIKDLDFIYNSILENHPAVYNMQDPNFNQRLKEAYDLSKNSIIKANNSIDKKKAITDFTRSFSDNHLWVHWFNKIPKEQADITEKFTVSELSYGVAWVRIPTFNITATQTKYFNEFINSVLNLRTNTHVIFDLRGNQGGNSDYGSQITNALFGQEYARQKRCLYNKNIYVDWRASNDNTSHISSLLAQNPNDHWLQNVEYGLRKSLEQDKHFYREFSPEDCISKENATSIAMTNVTIIVVTDSINVSAALDFIDELKIMTPNVILIGQTTKADRLYMEVRSVALPSRSGDFFFPIKVYRNRPRLDNEPYIPNIEFTHIRKTSLLKNFILEKIKEKRL